MSVKEISYIIRQRKRYSSSAESLLSALCNAEAKTEASKQVEVLRIPGVYSSHSLAEHCRIHACFFAEEQDCKSTKLCARANSR